jgi:predicted  nucleic acid-binding Zn-ribbon protein
LSIPDQILALERLAQIDAQLKELEEQIGQERSTLDGLNSGIARLDEKLAADRTALATMDKTRGELIQDVRNMTQQLEHSRDKLGRSRTERESNAAQRELEELRKLVRDREDEIGKLTTEADGVRQQVDATEAERKKLADELAARHGDISSKLGEVEGAAKKKRAERDQAIKALPTPLYRRYDMIRSKRGTALAQTTDLPRVSHVASAAGLLPAEARALARAVPLVQSHHLLRGTGRGRGRRRAVGARLNGRAPPRAIDANVHGAPVAR